jgi:peptidoglycan-associated lipoprotein
MAMKKSALFVALVAVVTVAGCHGNPKPTPQAARPTAPSTPPLAPPPAATGDVATQTDEYAKVKGMSADEIDRLGLLADIHFVFNSADLRDADRAVLAKNADALKKFDFLKITVEGHCDDRGTVEYNLALGDRRAKAANDYLVSLGVSHDRLKVVSYGKEVPVCQQQTEECWARNRRARFTVTGKTAGH